MKLDTKVVHTGVEPDPDTGAIMTPIYQTSTYVQAAPGDHKGYEYGRTQNPTRSALETSLAAVEGAAFGFAFSSGMSATDTVIKTLQRGDQVIVSNDLYGGSYRLFTKLYQDLDIEFHFVDMTNVSNVEACLSASTRMIWIESPTNPMLSIIDIEAISTLAHQHNSEIIVCVDNTFASPYLQQPLELGADVVMHSATKYLGGHSDIIMGALMLNDNALAEKIGFLQNTCGAVPSPHDCFLMLRSIKTLFVRMERHCKNGYAIAHFLRSHPKVEKVYYPGFEDHRGHEVAKKQMKDFGGMISFVLKKDELDAAVRFMQHTHLFALAESLGGVESLVGHPATMTHASIPREERLKSGLTDSLIRLSVGIENPDDLIEDLDRALSMV